MQHGWNSIIIISDQSDFEICISMSHIHEALVKPTILSLEHIARNFNIKNIMTRMLV